MQGRAQVKSVFAKELVLCSCTNMQSMRHRFDAHHTGSMGHPAATFAYKGAFYRKPRIPFLRPIGKNFQKRGELEGKLVQIRENHNSC